MFFEQFVDIYKQFSDIIDIRYLNRYNNHIICVINNIL